MKETHTQPTPLSSSVCMRAVMSGRKCVHFSGISGYNILLISETLVILHVVVISRLGCCIFHHITLFEAL